MSSTSLATPLVSVVIATYRRPLAIVRSVATALAQTMADLEILVVVERDDIETVTALAAITDSRLRHVVNPEKKGPAAARDFGAQKSLGHWLAFLDDDDEWLPTKLEKQLAAMPADGRAIGMTLSRVVGSQGVVVYPTLPYDGSEPIDEWLFGRRSWLKGGESMLQTSSLIMPRTLFDEVRFGQSRHEEWELVIRAVKQHGYTLITVREPLVVYYAGNPYPWEPSALWVDSVRDLLSPRAYSGFCLTVATQGLAPRERNRATWIFLRKALRHGKPTAKQLFAFGMIWLFPDHVRHRIRAILGRGRTARR